MVLPVRRGFAPLQVVMALAGAVLQVLACSTFGPSEAESNDDAGGEAGADASGRERDATEDVQGAQDAAQSGNDAAPGLLVNGDFEMSVTTCTPGWSGAMSGTAVATGLAISGQKACLICSSGANAYGTLGATLTSPAPGRYTLTGYVKQSPDGGGGVSLGLMRPAGPDAGSDRAWNAATPATPQLHQSPTLDVPTGTTALEVELSVYSPNNATCAIFDDVVLTHEP